MPRNDRYRRYLEAAAALGELTRARAEELVKELKGGGDAQRAQAQQWIDELVERGREAAGDLVDIVRTEVSKQLQALGLDPEDLAQHAAEAMRRTAEAGRRVVHDMAPGGGTRPAGGRGWSRTTATAEKTRGARKEGASSTAHAAKKSAAKAAAKGAAAKKSAATAAAKGAAAKKVAAAKKSVTKVPAARTAAAKKSVTKVPAARKSVSTRAPAKTTGAARPRTATTDVR